MNYKIKCIKKGILILISMLFTACQVYPKLYYEILDIDNQRQTSVKKTMKSYEELKQNGSIFYIEFTTLDNDFYSKMSIHVSQLQNSTNEILKELNKS